MALMDVETPAHPQGDILRRLAQGRLSAEEASAAHEHLAHCDSCCRFLEDVPDDSFVGKLREARHLPHADTLFGVATLCRQNEEPVELADHPRYRLIRLLGRGGMGAVYLADHRHMGRPVALKVVNSELLNQPGALARFQQEARAAAKLDHPNIVAAFDADQAGGVHFLVMGYVEGLNLADYLKQHGPLPIAQACDIVRQAALGLQHAHERGMVHRDIKPHNLMLTPVGQVKVLDFGLARLAAEPVGVPGSLTASGPSQLTGAGAVIGSADYIAPEQARDAHAADCRSDIYSLGCTLYQLLTNQLPFPDGTAPEKLERHGAAAPRGVASLRPEIPNDLDKVVTKMIAKNPEDRFQTAAEVADMLARFALGKNSARFRFRLKTAVAALIVCVCSVAAAAGVVRLSAGDREIVIETDDPLIEVVVKDNKIVRIVDPKTGKAYQLDRSDLTLSLADGPNGLAVTLDGGRTVTLKRDGTRIATVRVESAVRSEAYKLRHAKAPMVAAMVANAFRGSPFTTVKITSDDTANALIISGASDAVARILTFIVNVDEQAGQQPPMKPMDPVLPKGSVPPSIYEPLRVSPPPPVPAETTAPTPVPPPAGPVEKAKSELLLSRNALFGTADNFFKLNQFPEALRRYREIQDRYCNHFEGLLACYKIWSCVGYMVETPEQRSQVRAAALEAVKKARADLETMPEDSEDFRGGPDVWPKAEWQKRLRMIEEKLNAFDPASKPDPNAPVPAGTTVPTPVPPPADPVKPAPSPSAIEPVSIVAIDVTIALVQPAEAQRLAARWLTSPKSDTERQEGLNERPQPVFGVLKSKTGFVKELNNLRQQKLARVISEPKITTQSGRPAWLMSGGEAPIMLSNEKGKSSVTYKQFGTILNALPTVLPDGRIQLEVRPELSDLDAAAGIEINGPERTLVPGFHMQSSQTMVQMESGSTLVMGGLVVKGKDEPEREMIFLITPRIIDRKKAAKNQVQIDVIVARMSREKATLLWPDSPVNVGDKQTNAADKPPSMKSKVMRRGESSMLRQIMELREKGLAKLDLERRVVTLTGRPAWIVSGGETPIITTSANGQPNVSYTAFGTIINCLPIVLGNGKIHLEIRPELSSINPEGGISLMSAVGKTTGVVPGFDIRIAQVAVDIEEGETVAIGGLVKNNEETIILVSPRLVDLGGGE